jgi:hypothetical protein
MITHIDKLSAEVAARNEVNEISNRVYPEVIKALEPFVGKKVCKVDGTLLEKVKNALPKFERHNVTFIYGTGHGYSVSMQISTSRSYHPTGVVYQDNTVYFGNLNNGVLTDITPWHKDLRTDFTADEVRIVRKEIRELEDRVSQAKSKIHYFGA